MKRYRQQPLEVNNFVLTNGELFVHPEGEWIKYEDHKAENKKRQKDLKIVYESLIAKDYIAAIEILSEALKDGE